MHTPKWITQIGAAGADILALLRVAKTMTDLRKDPTIAGVAHNVRRIPVTVLLLALSVALLAVGEIILRFDDQKILQNQQRILSLLEHKAP